MSWFIGPQAVGKTVRRENALIIYSFESSEMMIGLCVDFIDICFVSHLFGVCIIIYNDIKIQNAYVFFKNAQYSISNKRNKIMINNNIFSTSTYHCVT